MPPKKKEPKESKKSKKGKEEKKEKGGKVWLKKINPFSRGKGVGGDEEPEIDKSPECQRAMTDKLYASCPDPETVITK